MKLSNKRMDRDEIIKYLTGQKEYFNHRYNIAQIGLFGSFARNTQTKDSDIDIVYTMAQNKKLSYYQLFEIIETLESHFKRNVELVNDKYMEPIIKHDAQKDIIYV